MIVVDASVLAYAVGDETTAGAAARALLLEEGQGSVPDLADPETVSVLRGWWRSRVIDEQRLSDAVEDLAALPLVRYPTSQFMRRAVELWQNVTPYDVCYVALAEALGCQLVTTDARLSRAPGIRCEVRVLTRA